MSQEHGSHVAMEPRAMAHRYSMLIVNLVLNLAVMYLAMFAMIYSWGEFIQNINFLYMALVMWAPMAAVMLVTMRPMYTSARLNLALHIAFAVVFFSAFAGIRSQSLIGDREFLRSMIPHHSGAILMCKRASIRDTEIRALCFGPNGIVESQTREISLMKRTLARL